MEYSVLRFTFHSFRSMKMGDFDSKGSGLSKKVAKTMAAASMYEMIPQKWKDMKPTAMNKKGGKRKRKTSSSEPAVKIQVCITLKSFLFLN